MKRYVKFSLALLLLSTTLSGCIIWPWWDEGGHRGGHGGYGHHDGYEHGERR